MRRVFTIVILGLIALTSQLSARAAGAGSDWPSLSYDAAQTNDNSAEKTLTAHNVLKLKVLWNVGIPDVSYPVVAGRRVYVPYVSHGQVHVRSLDAATGKSVARYTKQAQGGMLVDGGNLYLAGTQLQEIDPASGSTLAQVKASPTAPGGFFLNPVADHKVIVAGYVSPAGHSPGSGFLYAVDPATNRVLWKARSTTAQGSIGVGRVLTQTGGGSDFYDEITGKRVARQASFDSDWFSGSDLSYSVASVKRSKATLYAVDGTGHRVWKRVVGPYMVTTGWPHALGPDALYVQTLVPRSGVVAVVPESGAVLWSRAIPFIQRMVVANGVLYVLTYGLGQPVRLVLLQAGTGHPIGSVVLSAGYYAFGAPNGLMVADGMVFIRAVGPKGSQLLALGVPGQP